MLYNINSFSILHEKLLLVEKPGFFIFPLISYTVYQVSSTASHHEIQCFKKFFCATLFKILCNTGQLVVILIVIRLTEYLYS